MSKLTIPISVNLGNSLQKFKSIEDKLLALLGIYDKNEIGLKDLQQGFEGLEVGEKVVQGLQNVGNEANKQNANLNNLVQGVLDFGEAGDGIDDKVVNGLKNIQPAAQGVNTVLEKAKTAIINFGKGTAQIEEVIPAFAELVEQAGGIDQAFEALKDLPFFDEFKQGLEDGLNLIDQYGEKAIDLKFNPEPVKSVKQQLREANIELQNAVQQFGKLSPQAVAAAKRVAELKDVIEDAGNATKAADFDDQFQVFGRALQGVAGGFQTVLAVQGLFGEQSKETEEALKKVQAAFALTQGIESILLGVKAFKAIGAQIANANILTKIYAAGQVAAAAVTRLFGAAVNTTSVAFKGLAVAIAATGIGLLVVAVGALIPLLTKWFSSTNEAAKANENLKVSEEQLKNAIDKTNAAIAQRNKDIDFETEAAVLRAKIAGKTEEEIRKIREKGSKDRLEGAKADFEKEKKEFETQEGKLLNDLATVRAQGSKEEIDEAEKVYKNGVEALKKNLREKKEAVTNIEREITITSLENQAEDADKSRKIQKDKSDKAIELAKKNKEEILKIDKDLRERLKEIQIDVSLGNEVNVAEEQLKAFQEAAKQYLKLGFEVDSPQLKPILEQINQLKIQVGAEALRLAVKLQIDEGKKSKLEQLKEELAELQDKQLKVNTALEFQQIQNQIDGVQNEIDKITSGRPLIIPLELKTGRTQPIEIPLTDAEKKAAELAKTITSTLESGLESGLAGIGDAIGTAIVEGGNVFEAIGKTILSSLGSLLQEIGKQVIAANIAIEKVKLTFGVPILGVLAGIALVALGAALKASINKKTKQGFATGGYVEGPGTETSDSIPANLSKGEYVIKAKSVKKYGKDTFDKLNKGQLPTEEARNPARSIVRQLDDDLKQLFFNEGGLVTRQYGRNGGSSKALVNRTDDVPALVSKGEYIINENIVSRYGKAIFDNLNNGVVPREPWRAIVKNEEIDLDKFASGGFVSGKGTSTSDSIPALLSNGEYVINAKSVDRFGKGFFDNLNFNNTLKFANGGEVFRQFTRNSGSSKALVNRFETPQLDTSFNVAVPQTTGERFTQEVPYIATTRVSGQDLKIILERADKRFSNAT